MRYRSGHGNADSVLYDYGDAIRSYSNTCPKRRKDPESKNGSGTVITALH
jgi:hypothetical protein